VDVQDPVARVRKMAIRLLVRSSALLATLVLVALPSPASAKRKPPSSKAPAFYRGSITGSKTTHLPYAHVADQWKVSGLRLENTRNEVRFGQKRRIYKARDGNVTWTHQSSDSCITGSFTETFSLKGIRWDSDSKITFFAPVKGRFKNRWRVNGSISVRRSKVLGTCENSYPWRLPMLVSGSRVDRPAPVAKAGKTVRLSFASRRNLDDQGSYEESNDTMTIRPG
jgi:hypothetical protein